MYVEHYDEYYEELADWARRDIPKKESIGYGES